MYQNNTVIKSHGPLSDADIAAVEQRIGRALPDPLKEHYRQFNGGALQKRMFHRPNGGRTGLDAFLSMRPSGDGEFEETFLQVKVEEPFLPKDLIPFAIDSGGDFFCISDAPDRFGQIFFFATEDADDPAAATRYLAPSLKDFIEAMT
jgi:cell wall assembly regulator SMI1